MLLWRRRLACDDFSVDGLLPAGESPAPQLRPVIRLNWKKCEFESKIAAPAHTAKLAEIVCAIGFDDLDAATIVAVKRLIADGIAVAIAGTAEDAPKIVAAHDARRRRQSTGDGVGIRLQDDRDGAPPTRMRCPCTCSISSRCRARRRTRCRRRCRLRWRWPKRAAAAGAMSLPPAPRVSKSRAAFLQRRNPRAARCRFTHPA